MSAATSAAQLKLAQRMHQLLVRELGAGIDVRRMLAQPLYARDVLLVCDAMRGTELETLAQQFRSAAEAAAAEAEGQSQPGSLWPDSSGEAPSMWPKTWFKSGWRVRK